MINIDIHPETIYKKIEYVQEYQNIKNIDYN